MFKNSLRKNIFFIFLFLLLMVPVPVSAQEAGFRLHMLDVGQGLSILAEADGHYLLYDGGGRGSSSFVVSYLQKQGIEQIDCLIASHYDEDHISGLIGALHVFDCSRILCPDYEADTEIYQSFVSAAEDNGGEIIHPEAGESYALGDVAVDIVGPESYDCAVENDRSIAVKITYGDAGFLICGDTEEQGEEYMMDSGYDIRADVFVASHHGSNSSNSASFLHEVSPDCVLISCGKDNSYGHPGREALDRFRDAGCELYRTDRQGTVICSSDGESIWFDQEPCQDWSTNDDTESAEIQSEAAGEDHTGGITYVCNENSKKFHYESCGSVSRMKEENKRYTGESRDTLIARGYSPCQNCNP